MKSGFMAFILRDLCNTLFITKQIKFRIKFEIIIEVEFNSN